MCLLGAVRYTDASGTVIELPSATQRKVMALLAISPGDDVRAERLADLLDLSSGALRTTVLRLAAAIGHQTVATDRDGLPTHVPHGRHDLLVARRRPSTGPPNVVAARYAGALARAHAR